MKLLKKICSHNVRNLAALLNEGNEIKVNLGCGHNIQHGYINIDVRNQPGVDLVADIAWCFKHIKAQCHEVYLSHVLEHFGQPGKAMRDEPGTVLWVLQGVSSMLISGGMIRVAVPDFRALARVYTEQDFPFYPRIVGRLCGEQHYSENLHKCLFDRDFLTMCLQHCGFENIKSWEPELLGLKRDGSFDNLGGISTSLNLIAQKTS
ncbi:hypothetical protein CSA56_06265 [candidate division KSB3 bacterium]|uniref:Methyltransferase type 11 domain-containing protein n=1 Tax=candidate division KSB3 bacterium TaxID=2044937 RepID=A0A2G6KGW4_9BACT|nr:MAG: hypothetical protein CSA56_06265 [candidate division KSB3 bacterium]